MALITGSAAQWLEQNHEELNTRFRVMRRRFPQLDQTSFSVLLSEILPGFEGKEASLSDLYSSLYDVALLHTGRRALTDGSGLSVLLRESFSKLKPLLLEQPKSLAGALSNAVENLGDNGARFAQQIVSVAKSLTNGQQLLDAGAVLAWRLGEARLREQALQLAAKLPARAVLEALLLPSWPEEALPLVLLSLQADSWRHPKDLFKEKTLEQLPTMSPSERATLRHQLVQTSLVPPSEWVKVASLGNFLGFGGEFVSVPTLLQHPQESRHNLFLESNGKTFRMYADIFGSLCRPEEIQELNPRFAPSAKNKKKYTETTLFNDGSLQLRGSALKIPLAKGATSYSFFDQLLLFTNKDSFRITILSPHREKL
jgi:hypothetical protein